jgi:hypothetical protein
MSLFSPHAAAPLSSNSKLDLKTIGSIRGHFFVPGYQRGYRWAPDDVTRLLDDVWASKGQDYSLQPVVVKLRTKADKEADQEWELIDGQQRMTSLYLLLRYMREEVQQGMGAPYRLCYETRAGSETYLQTLDVATHESNIDFFHLYNAYRAIAAWFGRHGDLYEQNNVANILHGYLFNSVSVIWYQVPTHVEAIPLFTRLNVGRIPLTDAELVKAALLSRVRELFPERSHEIAAQWDGIERDLHQVDIWAFVAGLDREAGDEKYPTRISLLLDAQADAISEPPRLRPRYHTFDTLLPLIEQDHAAFWDSVVALHALILGWYGLPTIYNKIGFLVAKGESLGRLATQARDSRKSDFEQLLVHRIRTHIATTAADLEELNYEERKRGYPRLMDLLMLMNVETSSRSGLRFPFAQHVGHAWSLEHIHAQNAESLNKAEQWKTWLMTHRVALGAMAADIGEEAVAGLDAAVGAAIDDIDAGKAGGFSGEKFNVLSRALLTVLNHDLETDHTIRNLALLSSADNSRLNNSVFEVKRQMILDLDRKGKYVPHCTRNVFLKYYADANAQQPHFWSEQDKASYANEIRHILAPFLSQ